MCSNRTRACASRGCLAAAALSCAPLSAHAIDPQAVLSNPEVKAAISACQSDRAKFCATVLPGGGRIVKCLAANETNLTPQCLTAMQAARDSLVAGGLISAQALKK